MRHFDMLYLLVRHLFTNSLLYINPFINFNIFNENEKYPPSKVPQCRYNDHLLVLPLTSLKRMPVLSPSPCTYQEHKLLFLITETIKKNIFLLLPH